MRRALLLGTLAIAISSSLAWAQDDWRSQYHVGQQVSFTISGKPADVQTCTIVENAANAVMRVRCDMFKIWPAGKYIVHDADNVRPQGAQGIGRTPRVAQQAGRPSQANSATSTAASGTLKTGEYACYGSGGRIMIGLGFKVTGAGRYTDLDGKNAGRFTLAGGQVRFTGGHMGGQVGSMVGGNNFRIGQQARCEPY